MIRVKLIDGSSQEFRREEIQGLIPVSGLLRHPLLRFDALIYLHGKIIPVAGPLPTGESNAPVEERPWLMLFGAHAQVIKGLPQFDDDVKLAAPNPAPTLVKAFEPASPTISPEEEEEERLLREMEELLKGA